MTTATLAGTETFDILICDAATETVKSVAGYALPLEIRGEGRRPSVASVFVELTPMIRDNLILEIAESGQYRAGDILDPSQERTERIQRMIVEQPQRHKRITASQKGDSYSALAKQRMADCRCIRCGSASLVNAIHCEPCAQLNRERVSKSAAKSM